MTTPEELAGALAQRIAQSGIYDVESNARIIAQAIELDRAAAQEAISGRIGELLATANRYLEEARAARRERDALLRGFQGIAAAIAVMAAKDETA